MKRSKDPILCVNCSICINAKGKRWVAEENENLRQLLSKWICKEIEEKDAVCCICYYLLQQGIENNDDTRQLAHKNVCFSCGMSLVRLRCCDLENFPDHKLIIVQRVQPHQVKNLKQVCRACWQRADLLIKATKFKASIANSPSRSCSPEPDTISLLTYKRPPHTSSRCVFKGCQNTRLRRPRKFLKKRLLIDYSLYIDITARMCEEHLYSKHEDWKNLYDTCTITEFTDTHVENLFSLLNNSTFNCYSIIKFDALIKKHEVLCRYWLGIDYQQYRSLLDMIKPFRKKLKKPRRCLVIYLIIQNTGFSYKKIATLFGLSERYLVNIVKIFNKYLFENNVPELPKLIPVNDMVEKDITMVDLL